MIELKHFWASTTGHPTKKGLTAKQAAAYNTIQVHNYMTLYTVNYNQINVHALIGQSAMVYCAGKLTEKSRLPNSIV